MKKFKVFLGIMLLAIIALGAIRAYQAVNCQIVGFDLKRETSISWLTGNCTTPMPDGSNIYVDKLRGMAE